ncbi:MAG: caspase family protein [Pirellulales bacterium]
MNEAVGRLIILAIGVSQHKYPEYNLRYPASDAKALCVLMSKQVGLRFASVEQQLYVNERATADNIRDGLSWLQRISTPEDLVMVFIAGHGIRGRRGLYYMPHEGDPENLQNTCLNWEDIGKGLTTTEAQQIIFLSDVCHAGGFAKSELAMQKDLIISLSKLKNVLIFASSGADEVSSEFDRLRHGVFTWGLIHAFQPHVAGGDSLKLQDWVKRTIQVVQRETSGQQNPFVPATGAYDRDTLIGRFPR